MRSDIKLTVVTSTKSLNKSFFLFYSQNIYSNIL